MKFKLFIFKSILLIFNLNLWASVNSKIYTKTVSEIAEYLKHDPVYFTDGEFKGQIIDQSLKRPIQFIPELESETSYFASQFYNQKQFWIAEIPKKNVDKVIFQLALFNGPVGLTLAHGQFRFIGNTPVKLYRIKNGQISTTETKDFIFTVQAALPKGISYDAKNSILGNYKIVSRLVNTYDRAQLEEVNENDIVTQYELKNLSQIQKDQILKNAIAYSDKIKLNSTYYAIHKNCLSEAFLILDSVLPMKYEPITLTIENFLMNGQSPNEKMALDALSLRNLINSTSQIENYDRSKK